MKILWCREMHWNHPNCYNDMLLYRSYSDNVRIGTLLTMCIVSQTWHCMLKITIFIKHCRKVRGKENELTFTVWFRSKCRKRKLWCSHWFRMSRALSYGFSKVICQLVLDTSTKFIPRLTFHLSIKMSKVSVLIFFLLFVLYYL